MRNILRTSLRVLCLSIWALAVALIFAAAILFCSCSRKVFIPVNTERVITRSDTVRILSVRTDSVYVRDSIGSYSRGDTVFIDRLRERTKTVLLRDTLFLFAHSDSVKDVDIVLPGALDMDASLSNSKGIPLKTMIPIVMICLAVISVAIAFIIRKSRH